MRRNLLNLVAAASLALCVGAVALWVRGWFNGNVLQFYGAKHF